MRNKKRCRHEIIKDVLKILIKNPNSKKFYLISKANISNELSDKYTNILLNSDLIIINEDKLISISEKGIIYLQTFKEFEKKFGV